MELNTDLISGRSVGVESLSSSTLIKQRIQPWQMMVCVAVCGYLAVGAATHSVRTYHWFMLLAIPGSLLAAERGRQFFLDWAPLIAFWLVYDRLRLLQPALFHRVAVESPYLIERWAFGWITRGEAPAIAARAWLASEAGTPLSMTVLWLAQGIYFSHLFLVPLFFIWLWARGRNSEGARNQFAHHMRAFAFLNFLAIIIYVLLPVAPPWWVSVNGFARPTIELISQTNMSAAMNGELVRAMIKNAPQWFAAVPSLHGAYPVMLILLSLRNRRRITVVAIAVYCASMWGATVVLNQHYIIDLLAGALLALAAWRLASPVKINRPQSISPSLLRVKEGLRTSRE
jgi:inositol phosphorylceramide synthase catalytic subunit